MKYPIYAVAAVFTVVINLYYSQDAHSIDPAIIREVWQNLDSTENQCPDIYDYYPQGGMRIFYCHLKTYISYKDMLKLSGSTVFAKGPHSHRSLNLGARYDFGHYNKAFVIWLKENAIPAAEDPTFRTMTRPLYDEYVRPLAMTYKKTHELLFQDPGYMERERNLYLQHMEQQTLPEFYADRYFYFKDMEAMGYDGNVVKTAVLFWLRRSIDGTEKEFSNGLNALVEAYSN